MTRRSLIRLALLVLGCNPVWLGWVAGCVFRRTANGHPSLDPATLDSQSESPPLSAAEMEDLVAFGGVLVEARTLEPAERRYFVEHIEDRTRRSPGYLALYRTTVSTLDRLAGQSFFQLKVQERVDLVTRYRLADWRESPEEDLDPFPSEMPSIRAHAVPDLIQAYYASPAGWAVVGYESFPGRCGDLTRYARAER